jgi:tyrosine phenol-lyase
LTLPRRVYTQAHMDVVAESIIEVHERRAQITGLEMIFEPRFLRFFQARFRPLPARIDERLQSVDHLRATSEVH